MRRIALLLLPVLAVIVFVAAAPGREEGGDYVIRATFDSAGFLTDGSEVRVAGARVGVVTELDLDERGRAVVVMRIDEPGFQDFRRDASCLVRPQSLIGEKFVACEPTAPRQPEVEQPPPLEVIPDGEPGAGERRLPIEQTSKAVDIDLVQNIQRRPFNERFRIILNELGAGVAARGPELRAIVRRANPALRETNRVLAVLAEENETLARLSSDSDTVLTALARERERVTGFLAGAGETAAAAAERRAELERSLQLLPAFLAEFRPTMAELGSFAREATPLARDLRLAARDTSRATEELAPFAAATIPALQTLGDAGDAGRPALRTASPLFDQLTRLGRPLRPVSRDLALLLESLNRTRGFESLADFLHFTALSTNGFDQFGHYLRAGLLLNACITYATAPTLGCAATFTPGGVRGRGSSAAELPATAPVATEPDAARDPAPQPASPRPPAPQTADMPPSAPDGPGSDAGSLELLDFLLSD